MRKVTLTGTLKLYAIGQTVSGGINNLVSQILRNNGWGIESVSIMPISFSNSYNVRIVVNALNNDDSQRIRQGVIAAISNYNDAGDFLFRDVFLNITADTGIISGLPGGQAVGRVNFPQNNPIQTVQAVGDIATVYAVDEEPAQKSKFDTTTFVVLVLAAIVLARR